MASYWEMFTGQDWERASIIGGKVSCAACIVISILDLVFKYDTWIGVWTLFCGLLIAIWEIPILYTMIKNCEDIRSATLERLFLKYPLTKSFLYIALSILCYWKNTLCILAGVFLNIESLLLIFAYINQRSDAIDGLTTDDDASEVGGSSGGLLASASKFGTF